METGKGDNIPGQVFFYYAGFRVILQFFFAGSPLPQGHYNYYSPRTQRKHALARKGPLSIKNKNAPAAAKFPPEIEN